MLQGMREVAAEQYGPLTPQYVATLRKDFFRFYRAEVDRRLTKQRSRFIEEIREMPAELSRLFPSIPVTHRAVTVTIILASQQIPMQEKAAQQFLVRPAWAITLVDAAWGVEQVISAVSRAEEVKRGGIDSLVRFSARHLPAGDMRVAEQIAQAQERKKLIDRYESFGALLGEDPTGFLLVSEMVSHVAGDPSRIAREPFIHPYQIRPFVVAGAQMAADHYKQLFPVVQETLPDFSE